MRRAAAPETCTLRVPLLAWEFCFGFCFGFGFGFAWGFGFALGFLLWVWFSRIHPQSSKNYQTGVSVVNCLVLAIPSQAFGTLGCGCFGFIRSVRCGVFVGGGLTICEFLEPGTKIKLFRSNLPRLGKCLALCLSKGNAEQAAKPKTYKITRSS